MEESRVRGAQTPAELLLESVQKLVDSERRLREIEAEQEQLRSSYGSLAKQVKELAAAASLGKLVADVMPCLESKVRDVSMRDRIHSLVSDYIDAHELNAEDAQVVWMELYRAFRLHHGRDLARRARNRGATVSGLDIAEELDRTCRPGTLDDLYEIAHDRCGPSGVNSLIIAC